MFIEFIKALSLIFLAEMGDKTQMLALAFSTKYKMRNILIGVALGSFLNHGIAIALGSLLNNVIPMDIIQLVAGVMFIGFALLLALQVDFDEEEENTTSKKGPIITVATAFFIGELGDKTQLSALTLASDATFPAVILMGTVTGMVLTSIIGIIVGIKLGCSVPEKVMKLASFGIFMVFGLEKVINSIYFEPLNNTFVVVVAIALTMVSVNRVKKFLKEMEIKCNTTQIITDYKKSDATKNK